MKVVTFIEAYKSPITEIYNIHKYHQLLSKPFNHEELCYLFKNIESVESHDALIKYRYNINSNRGYEGDFSLLGYKDYRLYRDNYPGIKKYFASNLPINTVSDFINICNVAGFELEWSQHIIDEYSDNF
jgi:hypothetical protein